MGPIFAGSGRVISSRRPNTFGSRFRTNTKLLRGVFGPISMPNDYLNTVFDDVVSLPRELQKQCPPTVPNSLPACEKTFLTRKESLRNMLPVIAPSNRNIFTWIVRRASNAISQRNKIQNLQKSTVKKSFL